MGEQALWDRWAKSKDPRAFEALARKLQRFAFDFARRVTGHDADAEDLAQEALLDLAEAGPSKPAAVSVRAFVGRRIVLGARMLKRASLTRVRHEQAAAREGVEGPGEEGADARDALALLDEEDRRAVELRFLHGLSYAEVGHVLGVSEPAARMRVHRALASLRERLGPRAEAMIAALPLFGSPRALGAQTAAAAALGGGGIAVKKAAVAVLLLLAIAGGGLVVSRSVPAEERARADSWRTEAARGSASASGGVQHPSGSPADAQPPTEEVPEAEPASAQRTLVGRVGFEDGTPLRRAELKLINTRSSGTTDDDGRFHLRDKVVGGAYVGIVPRKDCYVAIARAELSGMEPLRLDVTLEHGTSLEGVVMKAGSPVRSANISLQRPGAPAAGVVQGSFGYCRTDEDGRFLFPHLPDGLYTVDLSRYGIEPKHVEIDVAAGLRLQTIVVNDARSLRIRMVPLPPAWRDRKFVFRINGADAASPLNHGFVLTPDEHGVMVVDEAPPPGRYVLCDLPGGYHEFEVTEAGVPEVVIDMSRFARVSGTVSVPCEIRIGPESGRVGTDGRYEIEYVPPGDAGVEIRIGKAILRRPSLAIPESGDVRLDIELRGVTVRGRLRHGGDSASGSVSLRVRGWVAYQAWIDEQGRFEIPFVEPGQYEIRGHSSGDTQGGSRQITVGMQDADVGEIEVASGVDVEVVVTAPAGVRLAGRHDLHAFDGRDHRFAVLYLDENGRGRISLPAGKWRLSLHVGDLPQSNVDAEIPVREPVRFDLAR